VERVRLAAGMIVAALVSSASADVAPITFDFNSLATPRGDFAISNYMSDVYGSGVSTDGARTVGERTDAADIFIATSLQLLGRGDFEIRFDTVPIIGAQFEGHIIDASSGEDFSFTAFNGTTQVLRVERNTGDEVFQSGWLAFPGPVDRIVISDNGRKDVGVDDLMVQPVPEPAAGLLLLVGGAALVHCSRRPFKATR
jgi:hypothetical protein